MSLLLTRVIALCVLFVITLLVGTVPVYLFQIWSKRKASRKVTIYSTRHKTVLSSNFYIQILTQIGGGILFYTVFVHMIPEIRDNFETYLKSNDSIFANKGEDDKQINSIGDLSIPYLELAICGGFFAIYLIEELMHTFLVKHDSDEKPKGDIELENKSTNSNNNNISELDSVMKRKNNDPILIAIKCDKCDCEVPLHLHNYLNEEPIFVRFLDGLIIIIAFSVHSLFDGISIGIKTTTSEIWTMFIAIASHKLLISFIISVELYEKCANIILVTFHMILFSIMSPIGILIVIIAEESISSESESNPIVVLLSAISSGTILYIVFFEILQKERVSRLSGIIQLVSMAIGFGIMFCVITTLRE